MQFWLKKPPYLLLLLLLFHFFDEFYVYIRKNNDVWRVDIIKKKKILLTHFIVLTKKNFLSIWKKMIWFFFWMNGVKVPLPTTYMKNIEKIMHVYNYYYYLILLFFIYVDIWIVLWLYFPPPLHPQKMFKNDPPPLSKQAESD